MVRLSALFPPLMMFAAAVQAQSEPGKGMVAGRVFDGANGTPVRQAVISVKSPIQVETVSDLDGKYSLSLPPGSYQLQFLAPQYLPAVLDKVDVKAGETTEASTVLAASTAVTTVEVSETVNAATATAEAMLMERKLAAAVSDGLSSEEIHQSVASDAAGALTRVTGVSVVDSGFVFVRGLGERYSSTMLNNAVIPTTEPEKRVVPLDLFPASLIDGIKVVKSYTPDLPGEFSGGVVQLSTVEFPSAKVLKFSVTSGYNSRTTGRKYLTYPGGSRDFFGADDGTRGLPGAIPPDQRIIQGKYTAQQLQAFGRSFANNWEPAEISTMRPQQSYSVVAGNTWGRFGVVGALTFSNRPVNLTEEQRYLRMGAHGPIVFTNYEDFQGYDESARLGGVLNLAVKLNSANKLVIRNTLTRDSDKESREFKGYDGSNDGNLWSQRQRFIQRGLLSTGVEGSHSLARLGNTLLKWQFTYAKSNRDEPDLREVIRGQVPDGRWVYLGLSSSGQRFFNEMDDRIYEPQVELSKPFFRGPVTGIFSVGFRGTFRSRDFQARRFRFIPQRSSTLPLFAASNMLFAPDNIRPDGFQLSEFTRSTDRYDATMDIYAGYAMLDVNLGPRWRVVGGLRMEDADIRVNTIDPLVPGAKPQTASLVNRDPMPAATAIYALTPRQNLRASWAHTVSRPDFRELSPFDFNNVYGGFVTQGNPNLMRATVNNTDARWEWFPGGNQLLAASFFIKSFRNPIEVTILPANDLRQTYVNAKGARNVGFELESRTELRKFSSKLRDFGVQGNFTFVDSNIEIRPEDASLLTSHSRPLLGQSRYIANFITDWRKARWRSDARFDLNFVSRRISDVGTFGLPDIYQEGNIFLDFSYQYALTEDAKYVVRFTGENLGDNRYQWTQGAFTQRSYYVGRTLSVGLTVSIF
ncbi:MAG: TonB-dependent receptor [Acidobacteria bacterium]|nr:TonB-dependent receptor [Acidobacteriota bacterium]